MRTTLDLPDNLLKQAKIKAAEEGISLKELFTRSLVKELSEHQTQQGTPPWESLRGKGSASGLSPKTSPFENYSGPDWNHAVQVNEPDDK
jgi:hypothetical protein